MQLRHDLLCVGCSTGGHSNLKKQCYVFVLGIPGCCVVAASVVATGAVVVDDLVALTMLIHSLLLLFHFDIATVLLLLNGPMH